MAGHQLLASKKVAQKFAAGFPIEPDEGHDSVTLALSREGRGEV